eukprot:gnl/TRDRNA2_/TRDRNA2_49078_c0_seq1.p1 gnl/TRDRNA2_/TRDRNA2_49078_c0~~gnl/TRDRNA2_/TRDRNA2_49078_c0_seq1.p1  ORF type:complete len:135 (-),score=11.04 gnl/TRDRNA2_/TRDRNA2_49078_c0_seq1:35-439(-)
MDALLVSRMFGGGAALTFHLDVPSSLGHGLHALTATFRRIKGMQANGYPVWMGNNGEGTDEAWLCTDENMHWCITRRRHDSGRIGWGMDFKTAVSAIASVTSHKRKLPSEMSFQHTNGQGSWIEDRAIKITRRD